MGTVSRARWTVDCSLTRGFTSAYLGLGVNSDLLHTTVFVSGMCHRPLSSRKSQSSRRTEHVRSDAVTAKRDTRKANQMSWGERQCKARPREWGQGRGQNAHRGLLPLGIRDQRPGWEKREPRIGRGVKPPGLLAGSEQHSRAGGKAPCMIGFADPAEWG